MNRRHALGLLSGFGLASCGKRMSVSQWRGICLGIPVQVDFRSLSDAEAQELGERVFAEIQPFEKTFSLWEGDSELSVLNRESRLSSPSSDLLGLLEKAGQLHQASDGLFDPTINSYLVWLKQEYAAGRTPDAGEAERRRQLVDFNQVEISSKEVTLPPGVTMDLNAIVQGHFTDFAADFLSDQCDSALVNFGEYRVVGSEAWQVGIEAPMTPTLSVTRALAVSSGAGERLTATSSANHLVHPKTGGSPEPMTVFAVEAEEAWLADGLATVISVGGEVPSEYAEVTVHQF